MRQGLSRPIQLASGGKGFLLQDVAMSATQRQHQEMHLKPSRAKHHLRISAR